MIYPVILLAASAALVSAQNPVTYNSSTGVFTCPTGLPAGAAFCAGSSLATNIIIRCTNGIGQPGNCNDNLAGVPPRSLWFAPCWQSSDTAGDAGCSKNCIVYGSWPSGNGTYTIPGCIPSYTESSTSTIATSTSASSSTNSVSTSTTASPKPTTSSASWSTTVTSTGTTTCVTDGTTTTQTFTTTYCLDSTLSTVTTSLPTGGSTNQTTSTSVIYPSNGTTTAAGPGVSTTTSPTATPVGPTSPPSPAVPFTGAAISNSAGAGLAAVGLFIAYFL